MFVMPTRLPTYLTYTSLPSTYLLTNYQLTYVLCPTMYLPTYLLLFVCLLFTYIPTFNLHKQVCTFKNIGGQACVPTYLPSQVPTNLLMKKFEIQILLYTLTKKFMEIQKSMLNTFSIILFYKVVGWFDGQDTSVKPRTKV